MSRKATVTITLEYTLSDLEFMRDENILEEDFMEVVIDQAEEDLRNYLRSESLDTYADIVVEDN